MTLDVMIDIETLGTSTDAAIVSIGAVQFNRYTGKLGREFSANIDIETALKFGKSDGSTLKFWLKQPDEARLAIASANHRVKLRRALNDLNRWMPKSECNVWGNGPAFDMVVLETAFKRTRIACPWRFWTHRCFRTISDIGYEIGLHYNRDQEGVLHNALDDAKRQARFTIKVLHSLIDFNG